jgi:hypothetical protein
MFKDAIPGTPMPRRVTRPMDFIVWFLVLLFILTVASRSNAQPTGPQCVTLAQATEQADRAGAAIVHLTPEQAKRAAQIYDSIPPATVSDAASAALVFLPIGGAILVGPAGMYCGSARIPPEAWDTIVARIMGWRS